MPSRAKNKALALHVLRGPFTLDAYQRLGELGVLRPDDRVELIGGQVVEMTPIGDRHASIVRRLNHHAAGVPRPPGLPFLVDDVLA